MGCKHPFSAEMPYDMLYQPSRKEASRKKPIFFIHKYFARRITANFRMSLLGFMADKEDDIFSSEEEDVERESYEIETGAVESLDLSSDDLPKRRNTRKKKTDDNIEVNDETSSTENGDE